MKNEKFEMTEAEELNLWRLYREKRSPEIREKLILRYAHYVKYVAGRVGGTLPDDVDFDDLVSYGVFGLIDAIEKFNPDQSVKFVTYALKRIRGAIIDGLRTLDWAPRTVRKQMKDLDRALVELEDRLGRPPEDSEIAEYLGITEKELKELFNHVKKTLMISLDELRYDDEDGLEKHTAISDTIVVDPETELEREEVRKLLIDAVEKLSSQERMVISLYYYKDLTIKEIATVMELSDSRVSQLHTKSILRLRGRLSKLKKEIVD